MSISPSWACCFGSQPSPCLAILFVPSPPPWLDYPGTVVFKREDSRWVEFDALITTPLQVITISCFNHWIKTSQRLCVCCMCTVCLCVCVVSLCCVYLSINVQLVYLLDQMLTIIIIVYCAIYNSYILEVERRISCQLYLFLSNGVTPWVSRDRIVWRQLMLSKDG